MTTPTMNDDLFDRVIQRIDADPDAFDMTTWLEERSCGTVGCFAGHTVLELGYRSSWAGAGYCIKDDLEGFESYSVNVSEVARNALGLTTDESESLFEAYDEVGYPATKEDVIMRWKQIKDQRDA